MDTLSRRINPQHTLCITTRVILSTGERIILYLQRRAGEVGAEGFTTLFWQISNKRTAVQWTESRRFRDPGCVNEGLSQSIDAVVIVGTRLQISDLRGFVDDVCQGAGDKECMTAWINKKHPVEHQYIGDCEWLCFINLRIDKNVSKFQGLALSLPLDGTARPHCSRHPPEKLSYSTRKFSY